MLCFKLRIQSHRSHVLLQLVSWVSGAEWLGPPWSRSARFQLASQQEDLLCCAPMCRLQCDGWAARMGPAGGCMRPKLKGGIGTCCAPEVACCKRGLAAYTPAGAAAPEWETWGRE